MRIETSGLITRRILKIGAARKSVKIPNYEKLAFIKDSSEIITILDDITKYKASAKDLALFAIYAEKWWNIDQTDAGRIARYSTKYAEIETSVAAEDKTAFTTALNASDLEGMVVVLNKYTSFDSLSHVSIADSYVQPEYYDYFMTVYEEINTRLSAAEADLPTLYAEYAAGVETSNAETPDFIVTPDSEELFTEKFALDAHDLLVGIKPDVLW